MVVNLSARTQDFQEGVGVLRTEEEGSATRAMPVQVPSYESAMTPDITLRDKRPGIATSSQCFRPGHVWLVSKEGEFGWIPTTCKTWRCKGCRDRMMSLFKARVEIGCSSLGRCAFITGTYKADVRSPTDATYVRKDWKELWRRLPHLKKSLKWLRVMEVTRKGTPHWHLVAGPIQHERIRCWSGKLRTKQYLRHWKTCDCLAHEFSRAWFSITGDSFIIHATPVLGARGAGAYMAKYMVKTFGAETRLKALGMARRWSSSRGWPGSGQLRLAPTEGCGWTTRTFRYGHLCADLVDRGTFLRVGDANTRAYFDKRALDRGPQTIRRLLNASGGY